MSQRMEVYLIAALVFLWLLPVMAKSPARLYRPSRGAKRLGATKLLGKVAPALRVSRWLKGDRKNPTLRSLRGKLVVVYAFQAGCSGCVYHGFPTMKRLIKHYRKRTDIEFVFIQTAFEGFHYNNYKRLRYMRRRFKIRRPIGHDSMLRRHTPYTMARYRTGGTPWSIVIDAKGRVRFNDFTRKYRFFRSLIGKLLREKKGAGKATKRS